MTLRRIDVRAEERRATPLSPVPDLEWVPVTALVINESYQRSIEKRGWASIRKIAENFHWGRFSPLLVARRDDGTFAVIDGKHRAHAAAICGIDRVPALVADLTDQEQAAAFSWVNGVVTALSSIQLYRAALSALEPWALQCDAAVSRAGCRMMTSNASAKNKKPGEIYCVGLIRKVIEDGLSAHLIAVLEGLITAEGVREEACFFTATHLEALIIASSRLGITRGDIIRDFLQARDLWKVESSIHTLREQPAYRRKAFKALYADALHVMMKDWLREVDAA